MANTYLTRTFGTPTNNKIWTCSAWLKRANSTNNHSHLSTGTDTSNRGVFYFNTGTSADFQYYEASGGSAQLWIQTNQQFRDCNGWYHIVVSVDTTQDTASNRWKLYVNGEQVTSFGTATYPSQNYDTFINKASARHDISGRNNHSNSDFYWEGAMSHYHFIDGTAYDASAFGETDATTGIWKPKTAPSVTYGTNGFFLKFENSAAFGTDSSGNANNFTVNGTMTQNIDTPSNVFATLNPLNIPTSNAPTFSNGNLKTVCGTTGGAYMGSATMGVSSGKYYSEMKVKTVDSVLAGISANASEDARDNVYPGQQGDSVGILLSSGAKYINDSGSTYGASLSANDILLIALDLDNNNVYFGKNGQWGNGSGSWNQSSPSSAISITTPSSTTDGFYFFSVGDGGGSQAGDVEWNFGSPMYTISSGNADEDGFGNFEYTVQSGYFALCSKNLAEYG